MWCEKCICCWVSLVELWHGGVMWSNGLTIANNITVPLVGKGKGKGIMQAITHIIMNIYICEQCYDL